MAFVIEDAPASAPKGRYVVEDAPEGIGDKILAGLDSVRQSSKNLNAGMVRGAGSIGATLLWPIDKATDLIKGDRGPTLSGLVTGQQPLSRNEERRQAMDSALQTMGAEPDSWAYKGGKLAGEIAGTAGAGGVLANGVRLAAPAASWAPKVAGALETGGFRLGGPAATTTAGRLGDAAVRVGAGAAVGGASAGAVNPEEAGAGAVIGAVLPGAAKVVGAAGKAIAGEISPEVTALYQKAKSLGIDIPADRIANSRPLNAVASSLNYVPLSGRAGTEEKMVSQLNRAVSRTFGQDSDNVTMALRKASGDLGGKFDQVLQNNSVKVDNQLLNDLTAHVQTATDELSPEQSKIISRQVDNLLAKVGPNGEIDGRAAYNIKKTLDRIGDRNSSEAYYARELKKSLMGALNRSLGPDEASAFGRVRQQYGTMLDLEGMAQNGAEGGISVGRLANMKGIKNPDLQDLADIAAQFVKTRENPHGSAQRVVQAAMGGGALVSGAMSPASIPAIAGGMATARGANMALNSPALKALLLNQQTAGERVNSLAGNPALRALLYNAPGVSNGR